MGLRIIKEKDGHVRPMWYARSTRNGGKVDVCLYVPIQGEIPTKTDANGRIVFDVNGEGDAAFRRSRKAAERALVDMTRKVSRDNADDENVSNAKSAALAAAYFRFRTGRPIPKATRLRDMFNIWESAQRNYVPTAERKRAARTTFNRFADFVSRYCKDNNVRCETIAEITTEIVCAFYQSIFTTYAWGTVKDMMTLLSGTYRRAMDVYAEKVDGKVQLPPSPFNKIIKRNREIENASVQREPLTEAQLARLFSLTEENPLLHDMVVTAACTGLRIGDVCTLKWEDINMRTKLIRCVTSKSGKSVPLHIFDPLADVLKNRAKTHAISDSPYVFPTAAEKYNYVSKKGNTSKRTWIVRAIKPYFARAIYPETEATEARLIDEKPRTLAEILAQIDAAGFSAEKKARIREIMTRRDAGEKCSEIAAALNIARGQVSAYLADVEALTGETYRPRIERKRATGNESTADLISKTRKKRIIGKHAASLYGWHSLRHTFCILALQNGVPPNEVRMIVGHGDVETTLMNYGNTSPEIVAERVGKKMKNTILAGNKCQALNTLNETIVVNDDKEMQKSEAATRALSITRALLSQDEAKQVDAVLSAAGVDTKTDPVRAVSITIATLNAETKSRIASVLNAARLTI